MGITNYYLDLTQGPYSVLATGPSLLYRNYFLPVDDNHIGQLEKEINLLENCPIKIQHGYAKINYNDELFLKNIDWDNLNLYQIGVHQNCQVTMTKNNLNKFKIFFNSTQIVHHVFASTFNFNNDVIPTPFNIEISKKLLENEYKLTILSAWENSLLFPNYIGSNKLFLTLLGGGVFRNPKEIIINSLIKSLDLIIKSGLDVYLINFNKSIEINSLISNFINLTGGKIISI